MMKTAGLIVGAVLAAGIAPGAMAQATSQFGFSFTAPLTNGDTASGSGTLSAVAEDGHYRVVSATGSYLPYQPDPGASYIPTRSIDGASSFVDFFGSPTDAILYQLPSGTFTTDSIAFYGDGFIGFTRQPDGTFDGGSIEVGVDGATLAFSPLAAGVPEPGSWALMLVGFGAVGYAMRRRRASVRVVHA